MKAEIDREGKKMGQPRYNGLPAKLALLYFDNLVSDGVSESESLYTYVRRKLMVRYDDRARFDRWLQDVANRLEDNKEKARQCALYRHNLENTKRGSAEWYRGVIYGAASQSLRNWIDQWSTDRLPLAKLKRLIDLFNCHIQALAQDIGKEFGADRVSKFEIADLCDEVSVYTFGEKLWLGKKDVQRIVDADLWRIQRPNFGHYVNELMANKFEKSYRGLYHVFYQSPIKKSTILRSTLRVRYKILIRKNTYLIRAKLHIPIVDHRLRQGLDKDYFSYDGYVVDCGANTYFWHFEENKQGDPGTPDFVEMATDDRVGSMASGFIMSTWEKKNDGRLIYSVPVVILKANHDDDGTEAFVDKAREFMRDDLGVIDGKQALSKYLVENYGKEKAQMVIGRLSW